MFVFQALKGLVFGNQIIQPVEIIGGSFYEIEKGSQKTLFLNANITFQATEPFSYDLIVRGVFDEEEELEPNQITEYNFTINEDINFCLTKLSEGRRRFSFKTPEGIELLFEFQNNETLSELFESCIHQCMYETKYQKQSSQATSEELEEFKRVKPVTSSTPSAIPPSMPNVSSPLSGRGPSSSVTTSASNSPFSESDGVACTVFKYDVSQRKYILTEKIAQACIKQTDPFTSTLELWSRGSILVSASLNSSLPITFNDKINGLTVSFTVSEVKTQTTWAFKIPHPVKENEFVEQIMNCIGISVAQGVDAYKDAFQFYRRLSVSSDVSEVSANNSDAEEEEDDQETRNIRSGTMINTLLDDDDDVTSGELGRSQFDSLKGAKNSQLAVGMTRSDRSFVVRGDKIGVFKLDEDNDLQHVATINNIRTKDGAVFSPAKVMLHQQDARMLTINPNNRSSLFDVDLELGKVVEEWRLDDYREVEDVAPDTKYSSRTINPIITGISRNSLFKVDPRVSGGRIVEENSKSYQTAMNFKVAATTGKGEVLVGNTKGELRLFDKINKQAKTNLPGLGDPIIGVDVSEDSEMILATCKTYLLLIETKNQDNSTGFTKAMKKENLKPIVLRLKPEHVAYMGSEPSFTPARFDMSEGTKEKSIIASTGAYIITWSLRQIKQGKLFDYRIRKYQDNVVADQFKYADNRAIVVTMPDNVAVASAKSLTSLH